MSENIFEKQMELLKQGVDNPEIADGERKIVAEFLDTMKKLKESAEPFVVLNEAAKKDSASFQQELAKFYSALVFIQGRTSDDVMRLTGTSRNMLASMQAQQEFAEKQAKESAVNNATSNRNAKIAIWIATVSLFVSILASVATGIVAHHDSESTSAAIVNAIRDCCKVLPNVDNCSSVANRRGAP